jgi:hypothetical protein
MRFCRMGSGSAAASGRASRRSLLGVMPTLDNIMQRTANSRHGQFCQRRSLGGENLAVLSARVEPYLRERHCSSNSARVARSLAAHANGLDDLFSVPQRSLADELLAIVAAGESTDDE